MPYFSHRYNYTWLNERAVEVALALEVLREHAGAETSSRSATCWRHYVPVDHLVVDKYEVAPGVVNADVADLETDRRFDLVLAVSTLEHVGLDEDVQDPEKAARAIARLKCAAHARRAAVGHAARRLQPRPRPRSCARASPASPGCARCVGTSTATAGAQVAGRRGLVGGVRPAPSTPRTASIVGEYPPRLTREFRLSVQNDARFATGGSHWSDMRYSPAR